MTRKGLWKKGGIALGGVFLFAGAVLLTLLLTGYLTDGVTAEEKRHIKELLDTEGEGLAIQSWESEVNKHPKNPLKAVRVRYTIEVDPKPPEGMQLITDAIIGPVKRPADPSRRHLYVSKKRDKVFLLKGGSVAILSQWENQDGDDWRDVVKQRFKTTNWSADNEP